MLFKAPQLGQAEISALDKIVAMRKSLKYVVSSPLRWYGALRRTTLSRAIRGSNSIEGYTVSKDDALAAVDGQEPIDADEITWREIVGYRSAMTYILQLTKDPDFEYGEAYLRSLHFILLSHDLSKNPGNWRPGPVHVRDESAGIVVYDAPDRNLVEPLMAELIQELRTPLNGDSQIIRAAMAHLNFVMIHPFSDGNGRIARCLQTLVLSRDGIIEPDFCSVEEYLGRFTPDYYRVLAQVGQGKWNPQNNALPWIRFMLKAHFQQGQLLEYRMKLMGRLWEEIEIIVKQNGLPERMLEPLFMATMGRKLRNVQYRQAAEVSNNLASRDFKLLVDRGLLLAEGNNRGRFYTATHALTFLKAKVYEPFKAIDPFEPEPGPYLPGMEP
jgi:Fic family protein